MQKELTWDHDMIWGTSQWPSSYLPCQLNWLQKFHVGPCSCLWASFWPACWWNLSSHTLITSQSQVHLHLWQNRNAASLRFFWAVTKTCCLLLGIKLVFLPPDFLKTLQTFLSVRTHCLSGLSRPCSLMSKWVDSRINSSWKHISWSHDASF